MGAGWNRVPLPTKAVNQREVVDGQSIRTQKRRSPVNMAQRSALPRLSDCREVLCVPAKLPEAAGTDTHRSFWPLSRRVGLCLSDHPWNDSAGAGNEARNGDFGWSLALRD